MFPVVQIKELVLPKSLKFVGEFCFAHCTINNIVIPFDCSIETISDKAFYLIDNIDSLTIPRSVKKIGKNIVSASVHSGYTPQRIIYYGGSKSEWDKIEIDENSFLDQFKIIYLGGDE